MSEAAGLSLLRGCCLHRWLPLPDVSTDAEGGKLSGLLSPKRTKRFARRVAGKTGKDVPFRSRGRVVGTRTHLHEDTVAATRAEGRGEAHTLHPAHTAAQISLLIQA